MPADDISGSSIKQDAKGTAREPRRKTALAILALILLLLATCCGIGWSQMGTVPDVIGMTEEEARAALEEAGFEVEIVDDGDADESDEGDSTDSSGQLVVVSQSPEPGGRFMRGTRVRLTMGPAPSSSDGSGGDDDSGEGASSGTSGSLALPGTGDAGEDDDGYTVVSGVSSSPPDRRPVVPAVHNMTEAEAITALRNSGFTPVVGGYRPTAGSVVAGRVWYQDPAPETRANYGTTVTIWISTGGPGVGGDYVTTPYPQP